MYDIEDILSNLDDLDGKLMDLGEDFNPLYRFDIDSRLVSLGSRLNFLKSTVQEEKESSVKISK